MDYPIHHRLVLSTILLQKESDLYCPIGDICRITQTFQCIDTKQYTCISKVPYYSHSCHIDPECFTGFAARQVNGPSLHFPEYLLERELVRLTNPALQRVGGDCGRSVYISRQSVGKELP